MNDQTHNFNAPATLANIDDLCDGRNRAIAHWLAAYDAFHEHTRAAGLACIGTAYLSTGRSNGSPTEDLCNALLAKPDKPVTWWKDGKQHSKPARDHFAELVTAQLDRSAWDALLDLVGGRDLMDREAKEQWRESLRDPAPFTAENCRATFSNLWGNRRALYLRGIANAFSRLDRRFRSHDGFKVGARLIIDGALDMSCSTPHWRHYERRDTFDDVERLVAELDGKPAPCGGKTRTWPDGTKEEIPEVERSVVERVREVRVRDLPTVIQGAYFRVRVFKNGNLHIWFENDDLLRRVNLMLAEYYGEALGDGHNETEAEPAAPGYHVTPAKNFGAFNCSPEVAQMVRRYASIGEGTRVLEPSAGTGELAKVARAAGGAVECIEIQHGLAHELAEVHGFKTYRGDFLQASPVTTGLFDVVLMNPPFDRGRDCDHVRHAWQFLKPGGCLVAIMAARAEFGDDARHKALHKIVDAAESSWGSDKWHDLPAGSFAHAGTQVNTVVLTLRKPRGV